MFSILLSDRIWVLTFIRHVHQLIILIVKQWPLVPGHRSVVNIYFVIWKTCAIQFYVIHIPQPSTDEVTQGLVQVLCSLKNLFNAKWADQCTQSLSKYVETKRSARQNANKRDKD